MAKLRLVDTQEKFLLEVDGKEIPYVTSYEITRTVGNCLLLKLALSISDVQEVDITTDKMEVQNQFRRENKLNAQ